jgi:hypothetical protein
LMTVCYQAQDGIQTFTENVRHAPPSDNFHLYPLNNSWYKYRASRMAQEPTDGKTVQSTLSTLFFTDSSQYYPLNSSAWFLPLMFSD